MRNDSQVLLAHQKKFFDTIFFPILEERNIDTVIHLGDLVDRRKYINFNTSMRMRRDFLDRLIDKNVIFIVGNHDVYHKNTNSLNCFNELKIYPFSVYTEATNVKVGGSEILLLPWINPENHEHAMETISASKAQVCIGHLELQGFEMERGHICMHGLTKNLFDKFDMTFSGHFHHKSQQGSIHYLGSPYQMSWADFGSRKGFHIFDTETRELEFIENPYKLFHRLVYDDRVASMINQVLPSPAEEAMIPGAYIKIVVEHKVNPYYFDLYLNHVETLQPYDLKVVQQQSLDMNNSDLIDTCEDTMTIVSKSIDSLEVSTDKMKLKSLMSELYKQAQFMEV